MLRTESHMMGRKLSKRRLVVTGLCLAAASYFSVLVLLSWCDSANTRDGSSLPKLPVSRIGLAQLPIHREGGQSDADRALEPGSFAGGKKAHQDAPDVDSSAKRGRNDGFIGARSGLMGGGTHTSGLEKGAEHSPAEQGGAEGPARKQWPAVLPNEGRSAGMQQGDILSAILHTWEGTQHFGVASRTCDRYVDSASRHPVNMKKFP